MKSGLNEKCVRFQDNSEVNKNVSESKEEAQVTGETNSSRDPVDQVAVSAENSTDAEPRNSRANAEKSNESSKWTTYSPYPQNNYDSNQQQSGRFSSGGGRFTENSKFSSFGSRDNRRDNRKDGRRDGDRRPEGRYFKSRDDNYSGGRSESNAFPSKWGDRSRNGQFRSRNGGLGGPRRQDRDDGRMNHNNYPDRNDYNSATSNRSSGSSINNLRDDIEAPRDNHEDRKFSDERLIDDSANVVHADHTEVKDSQPPESLDDRLKTVAGEEKLPENGNGNNEETEGDAGTALADNAKNSTVQPDFEDNSFSSGKSRKKDKKKKNLDRNDESNEKEILKPIENERKLNNQKDEKKKNLGN